MSVGLASSVLICLWIQDELQIDTYNTRNSVLFQVMRTEPGINEVKTEEYTPGPLAQTLALNMPEVEHAVSVIPPAAIYRGVISSGNHLAYANTQFADSDFFNVFTYDFIQGDKNTVLRDNQAISISEAMALKLFRTTRNVTGKIVKFENEYFNGEYIVSGIFRQPSHSSRPFDILFNYQLYLERRPETGEWRNGGPSTFVILRKGTDEGYLNYKMTLLLQEKRKGSRETLFVQRYAERYLFGTYENGRPVSGRIVYIRLFSIIALFILAIACINFMNMSTAQASGRMKEVGIKKVMGAGQKSLIFGFIGESIVLSFLSLFLALLIIEIILPRFNLITGKSLTLNLSPEFCLTLVVIPLVTGLAAGCYPSIYLSAFAPAEALKGKIKNSGASLLIRKGLVIFQFVISILLILSVLIVYHQIEFIQKKNPGYDKAHIISLAKEGNLEKNFAAFISKLKSLPGVNNASYMYGSLPGGISSRSGGFFWEGQYPGQPQPQFDYLDVDYGLVETLGLQLKSGRSFSRDYGKDSSGIIFNESAINAMGLKDPLGKTVNFYGKKQIIGVVKDFHFESLFEKVKPFFFKIEYEKGGNILVRMKPGTEKTTLRSIESVFHQFNKGYPFSYKFLDEDYQAQYTSENRVAILSRYFAGIAILISCMGLFGLAAFTVERRSKEIAIRKVLGCAGSGIFYLLAIYFIQIMLAAILISFPIGYIISKNWLNNFAYKIALEWWHFGVAGILAILIAFITISLQICSASRINPAATLKE